MGKIKENELCSLAKDSEYAVVLEGKSKGEH